MDVIVCGCAATSGKDIVAASRQYTYTELHWSQSHSILMKSSSQPFIINGADNSVTLSNGFFKAHRLNTFPLP
ncbi:hypothetical protein F8388_013572 [Cannabis sativa]|uniref:Uncharacterized protein n=1 Tax=Cannabis sativa TaxID=3483 RepID=A0A7J6G8U9_CANSA|nr:hypothetical protein F8388_013572 [Cannabis sativa]